MPAISMPLNTGSPPLTHSQGDGNCRHPPLSGGQSSAPPLPRKPFSLFGRA
jgi:hypothetical protein